jgi:hypothetical protein
MGEGKDRMKRDVPVRLNVLLITGFAFVNLYQFLLLPLFLLPGSAWWLLTLIPCILTSNSMRFLISFANNIAHYGTRGNTEYALSPRLPAAVDALFLYFYNHRLHHLARHAPIFNQSACSP